MDAVANMLSKHGVTGYVVGRTSTNTEIGEDMVIKVSWQTVKTPTLADSPHSVEMYYEVDSVPDTAKVIHHLRGTVKFLDPNTVLVEETDLDASELRDKKISVHKIQF